MTSDRRATRASSADSANEATGDQRGDPPADSWAALFGPLRHRLVLLLAVVLLPSILLASYQATVVYDEYAARLRQTVRQFAVLASSLDRGLLTQSEQLLWSAADRPEVAVAIAGGTRANAECGAALEQLVAPFTIYAFLAFYDQDGHVRCLSRSGQPATDISATPWFQEVKNTNQSGSSGYLELPPSGEPGLILTHPVTRGGEFKGALALGVRLQFLSTVTDESGLPPQSVVYLLDEQGKILTGYDSGDLSGAPSEIILRSVGSGEHAEFTAAGTDGVNRLYASSTMPYYDLHVLFGVPEAQFLDPLFWKVATQVLIVLGAWILGLLAALPGARWVVTRWTDRLTESARAMSKGDLAARPDVAGAPEELRLLGETLAGLAARVQQREAELGTALAQHKTMLREVHHRVKNNLQTVTSLLNLHAKGPRAAPARQIFADVQVRINALALVHRHLYESDDMRVVALRPFLTNLCRLVQDGTGVSARQVSLTIDIEEISVPGDIAVPIALLVTEVLTNAFKHGFPAGRQGAIRVRLEKEDASTAQLTVEDNGVGQAEPDSAMETAGGIGFSLIGAFARQLDGRLSYNGPPGTSVSVRFPLIRGAARIADGEDEDRSADFELATMEAESADSAKRIRRAPRSEDRDTRRQ